jgi:hypothetical protein
VTLVLTCTHNIEARKIKAEIPAPHLLGLENLLRDFAPEKWQGYLVKD